MNSAHLEKVEEVYHAAAELSPDERQAFLEKACAGDDLLMKEVLELLSFDDVPDSFIDNPPDEIAAQMFADEEPRQSLIGKTIGRYSIERLIGAGGMGEVYLARDTQLNRKVALKLLPPSMVENPGRLKRFKHEAQAVSALNHPNILTIHEFGSEDVVDYIVSEFVDGVTLRRKIRNSRVIVRETVDICIQIASALAAAHAAGIVHRDIKPDNIMIRADGIVKVLDFGLAKLTSADVSASAGGGEAATLFKTEPGTVMGTVGYMSPEQARGTRVDARTDIWSLGVIIYEMLTGRRPFEGDTKTDVLVAILNQPPPMSGDSESAIPAEIRGVIEKALAKNVDQRYASIEELAADLATYKQRLVFDAEIRKTENNRITVDNRWPREKSLTSARAMSAEPPHSAIVAPRSALTIGRLLPVLAAVLAAAAIGIFVWQRSAPEPITQAAVQNPPSANAQNSIAPLRTLAYSLTVQSFTDGRYKDPFRLSGEMLFRNKDRIRINVKSPDAGYLYILNQGPGGEPRYNILFPSPTANNGSSSLAAAQEVQIPRDSWFELDEKEGAELIWLIWSGTELPDLESAKQYANAQDKGQIKDDAVNKTIASLLQTHGVGKAAVVRDDDKQESRVEANSDIVARAIRLEHH